MRYRRHQEHCKEARSGFRRASGDGIANCRHDHQADDMNTAISATARSICDNERNEECCEPDRDGEEKCFDVSVAECIDDRREEVLERLRKK